jgi:hypothetical protein
MNLPIRALYTIKAFSKPMTRVDWRTCNRRVSRLILIHKCMSMFKYLRMELVDTRPILEDQWDAEKVIGLLAIYAEAKVAFDEAYEYKEWGKCELHLRGSLVQLMIGLVGLQEYARMRGYEIE